jgi:two-component system sensor histidine kinase BaeS
VIAGLILARWLAKPLVDAARTARRMARGERGVPVSKSGPAEIVDVADALAALDSALTSSEARQREFLLSISHELRTPLTALRGYAEALADGVVPAGDIAAVGATLVSETQRLDRFVADLLELARLEADDFSISVDTVDVGAMLSSTCETWLGRASALGVDLVASSSTIITTTDPRRLRQILDGLVENALRVTPAGEEIRLSAHAELARVVIEVRDGGPGISAEDAAVAFDRGVLRDRYRDVRPVGTGLGLSIAARLAKRLGATISAAGVPGGGSAFTVTLPY